MSACRGNLRAGQWFSSPRGTSPRRAAAREPAGAVDTAELSHPVRLGRAPPRPAGCPPRRARPDSGRLAGAGAPELPSFAQQTAPTPCARWSDQAARRCCVLATADGSAAGRETPAPTAQTCGEAGATECRPAPPSANSSPPTSRNRSATRGQGLDQLRRNVFPTLPKLRTADARFLRGLRAARPPAPRGPERRRSRSRLTPAADHPRTLSCSPMQRAYTIDGSHLYHRPQGSTRPDHAPSNAPGPESFPRLPPSSAPISRSICQATCAVLSALVRDGRSRPGAVGHRGGKTTPSPRRRSGAGFSRRPVGASRGQGAAHWRVSRS